MKAFSTYFLPPYKYSLSHYWHPTGLEEAQAGIKIAGRNINNLRYPDDTTFMAESEEELKSLWELDCEESWAWRIDAFELWCWRRLLRVPWEVRRSNQSVLKEINPEYWLKNVWLIWRWLQNPVWHVADGGGTGSVWVWAGSLESAFLAPTTVVSDSLQPHGL